MGCCSSSPIASDVPDGAQQEIGAANTWTVDKAHQLQAARAPRVPAPAAARPRGGAPLAAWMRRSSQHVTVDSLRTELERFARDTLKQEFTTLRDHIDKTVRGELQAASKRWVLRPSASPVEDSTFGGWDRTGAAGFHDEATTLPAPDAANRRSTFIVSKAGRDSSEVKWATRRTGFRNTSDDLSNFGRRRLSSRHQASTGQRQPAETPATYAPICKEETAGSGETGSRYLLDGVGAIPEEGPEENDERGSGLDSRDMAMMIGEVRSMDTGPSMCSRVHSTLEAVMRSEAFDYLIGGIILLNAVVIGMETQYMAANWCAESPPFFLAVDRLFCAIFLLEIAVRFFVSGLAFFTEPGWHWNTFDLLVVSMQLLDEAMRVLTHLEPAKQLKGVAGNQLRAMRIFRLFRLVRLLRLTRMLYLLGGLRMLVVSIADSLRSLAWTLFLLFVLTFVFGVFLTQLVTDHKVQHRDGEEEMEHMEELLYFFGSLDRAMLCLYETISEGNHWHEVVKPLMDQCGRWLALLFIAYMSFTLFALMNVVTGVFCESAIRTAEEDKKQVLMQQMHELFLEADDDGSGTISAEEFEAHLKDPQMLSYLKAIDVNPEEARHLFALLDAEEHGEIEAEALVNGCLRLQGSAKAIELAAFMQEHKQEYARLMDHAELVERSLAFLCETTANREEKDSCKGGDKVAASPGAAEAS